ncbi:MAG: hybrid sensor histidine kinase/response regulator [Rhodothermales bacterium]
MSETHLQEEDPCRRILVVDDNATNREMLVDFVDLLGHECRQASNGIDAMAIIEQWRPDTILLDKQMPGMDGMQVLEALSENEELRHIPVILLSGMDDLNTVTEALEAGAVDFMAKPFNPAVLRARLSSSLERKALRDRERQLLHSLEKSYRDLQASENGRQALTDMIVHDLGNPLSIIKMNAELIAMTASAGTDIPTDALMQRIGHISAASGSMDTMIQSILDLSKMEAGLLEPATERVDVAALLTALHTRFEQMATDAQVVISLDVPSSCLVETDPVLLERMVSNLLTNAFKYAHGARDVLLSVTATDDAFEVAVADNGAGIPDHLHERIFDSFYQARSRESGAPRAGVGLGLAFCRMAAQVQGGSIWVENNTPQGTRFVFSLPRR